MNRLMLAIGASLALGAGTAAYAEELEFEEADIFFELNNTDGDLGIHGKVDGGPWTRIRISDGEDRTLMDVRSRGRLKGQAVTELFFESAEPTFDELTPEEFFARFPEGTYNIEGVTEDGEPITGESDMTHTMPAPPEPTVNGKPIGEVCDDEDPEFDAVEVKLNKAVEIAWAPVTMSHPDLGNVGVPISVHNYEVVVEADIELGPDEELATVMSIVLPPDATSVVVPKEFLAQSEEWKFEVLVREESFNQTATESCFVAQ